MRASLAAGYAFVFTLSALVGYWLGQKTTPQLSSINQADAVFPLPSIPNAGQINLLLVNVKQLDNLRPNLQVIWLVAFNPDTPIKLIPVFPSYTQDPVKDTELLKIFGLKKNGAHFDLNASTVQILEDRGLEWDGSIVLDNRALANFIDAFGSIKLGEDTLDRDQLASYKFPMFKTSQLSLTFHTLLWREVCWNILHSPGNISNLSSEFKKHASVAFSEEVAGQDWITLLTNVKIPSCEFPMFFQANP